VLCGVGAGILSIPSFGLFNRASFNRANTSVVRLIFVLSFMCVGWVSLFNRTSSSVPLGIKFQSFIRFTGDQSVPVSSFNESVRRTSTYVIITVYQAVLQQCIQPVTSDVNIFAIYHYIFITFRSSYNVLCYHTMLAGATWGIKCDKQALPLRPVF
jgi:hypothetical protein